MNTEVCENTAEAAAVPASPVSPLPHEPADAFDALRVYLELGPRRRYSAVCQKTGYASRTVKRWATDFAWRDRIKASIEREAGQRAESIRAAAEQDALSDAVREKAFRDRQLLVAESLLDAAESYLDRMDPNDLDAMSFADACKAFEVASNLRKEARANVAEDSNSPDSTLRDQLSALVDQAFANVKTPGSSVVGGASLNA